MLGVTERGLVRPSHELAQVVVHVLAGFCQQRIDGPHRDIGEQHPDDGALPPRRIDERGKQSPRDRFDTVELRGRS
jgi:hypothetical protein